MDDIHDRELNVNNPPRRLTRSDDRMIAGVCGGLAEYFGWDVTTVRVLYVLLSVISVAFPGLLMYLVLWWVMPAPEDDEFERDEYRR
jgi:phage shock protein PspC (stress-responsive transcriptional regulator)